MITVGEEVEGMLHGCLRLRLLALHDTPLPFKCCVGAAFVFRSGWCFFWGVRGCDVCVYLLTHFPLARHC